MSNHRPPKPPSVVPIDVPPLAPDATPRQREVFRVERMLALSAARLGIVVAADGRVSSKDAARLILPHRRDDDGQLRKWRYEGTGPQSAPYGRRRVFYTLHTLAVWQVAQLGDVSA